MDATVPPNVDPHDDLSRFDFRAHFEESGLLRSAVEGAQIGLWSTDLTTGLTDCTRLMFMLLGLDPNRQPLDVAGWRQVVHPDDFDALVSGWADAARTHSVYEGEYRIVRPDGEVRWLFSSGRYQYGTDGEPERISGISKDVTERKLAVQALEQADRRKAEFLAILGHELRSPLAPISIAIEILGLPEHQPNAHATALDVMNRQVHHLTSLVRDLLDVSGISVGKLAMTRSHIDIDSFLNPAIELARPRMQREAQTLAIDVPSDPVYVLGDMQRLTQAVGNLLNNATKYNHRGGSITLTVTTTDDEVRIAIRDNGVGIAPEKLDAIFELFTQVDDGNSCHVSGLGIGLYLVRHIAEWHAGTVSVISAGLGHGSTFQIALPRSRA